MIRTERVIIASALLLAVVTFILYLPVLGFPFVNFDDDYWVLKNPGIRDLSWDGIKFLFTEDVRDFRYFPLSYLSFAIDYYFFELDPKYFHLHNLILHILNTLLVLVLILKVFKNRFVAIGTAVLFAIHPIQVESVAWVMSRKNVLFLFYFLLSAIAYIYYYRQSKRTSPIAIMLLLASVIFYLLSGLSKTTGITLPAVLLLLDYYFDPNARSNLLGFLKKNIPSKLFYFVPLAFLVLMNKIRTGLSPFNVDYNFSITDWIMIPGHNITFYLVKTLAPTKLAVFYPFISDAGYPVHYFVYTALSVMVLFATAWFLIRNNKMLFWCSAYYLITLSPMALSVLLTSDVPILAADRYFYQSSIGVFVLVSWGLYYIWNNFARNNTLVKGTVIITSISVIAILTVLSRNQIKTWQNTIALFENEVHHYPSDAFYKLLAIEYNNSGLTRKAMNALDRSETAPYNFYFHNITWHELEIFNLYFIKGDLDAAIEHYIRAMNASPNHMEPFSSKTPIAYLYLSRLYRLNGDFERAEKARLMAESAQFDEKDQFEWYLFTDNPDNIERFLIGMTEQNPDDGMAWFYLGYYYYMHGNDRKLDKCTEKLLELGYEKPKSR